MKTTLEVDQALLNEAKKILGTHTIRETVEKSLQSVVRQRALKELVNSFGTIEMFTREELKKQRMARHKYDAPR